RVVRPRCAHDAVGADEKGRPLRDVLQTPEVEGDVEATGRLAIPVGEKWKVEIERLHPRDVRPRRVARDRVRLHARGPELLAPVTQELHLVRSGRRPVEEVEEQQDRALARDLDEGRALLRRRPHPRLGYAIADLDHAGTSAEA